MIDKIKAIVEQLNILEAERLKQEGYKAFFNTDNTLTDSVKVTFLEKPKYFYINFGTSGAFMIAKEEVKGFPIGSIFNIKGYGTPNFNKCYGTINEIDIKKLHSLRWDYRR